MWGICGASFMSAGIRLPTEFGSVVKAARLAVGMSIKELAEQSGRA